MAVFLIAHLFILNNFILLSRDVICGDFSAESISPQPRYPFKRNIASEYRGKDRLSADFATLYYPSREFSSLIDNYAKGAFDPWNRPSRSAPFSHFMCAISICRLDYGPAAFLNTLCQLLVFYFSFAYAFKVLDVKKYFLPSLLLVNYCLFLTPVGISWFERGQWSLYIASAYLWLILGLQTRNRWHILLSALFSFVKWTSLPYIFAMLAANILSAVRLASNDRKELARALVFAGIFAGVFALLSAPFFTETMFFLTGISGQELLCSPVDLSLMHFLPRALVKSLPLILIGLGWLAARRLKDQPLHLAPYFAGAATVLITYPTIAYDYSLPVLFGFIPLLLAWARLPRVAGGPVGAITVAFFALFLVGASFSREISQIIPVAHADVLLYAIAGSSLAVLPLLYPGTDIHLGTRGTT